MVSTHDAGSSALVPAAALSHLGGSPLGLAAGDEARNPETDQTASDEEDDAEDDDDTGLLRSPVALGELVDSVANNDGVDGGHCD
nr:uncharacterized protein CTRU02_04919 [Colletotrichum truncatum]KAF6794718.1 hypothetical protein CTRU02_04919 [Colletotrichum truncatum]